jgi:hypothetical protein
MLAVVAALFAAATLPHAPLGIDVPLMAVLVAAAICTTARRSLDFALFGSLAFALACMPALLDAGWVAALDVAAASLLATAAVAGPRLVALFAPLRALGGVPALVPRAPEGSTPMLRGLGLGTMLVIPFGALFWTADAAFAELGRSLPLPSVSSLPARVFVFALVLFGALGLALAARQAFEDRALPAPKLSLSEWAIALVLLDMLFLAFVVVQVTVLFGGHDHVLETADLTYAEYARQGFWQLIAAAALTLVVVVTATRAAEVRSRLQANVLRALLGTLCVLTIVIVVSALHRLGLYEDAFGLTRARLAAETVTWCLGGFFVLVLLAGAIAQVRRQVGRIAIAGSALVLLAFSLSNPDGRVAQRNVDRWQTTGDLDIAYLQRLSADAVPILVKLPEPLRTEVLVPFRARLENDEPWTSANYGRHRAREALQR